MATSSGSRSPNYVQKCSNFWCLDHANSHFYGLQVRSYRRWRRGEEGRGGKVEDGGIIMGDVEKYTKRNELVKMTNFGWSTSFP